MNKSNTRKPLDVLGNRRAQKWSKRENLGRVLWAILSPLFRLSPRPFWAWRRFMLRAFGARVGAHVHIYPTVRITIPWNLCFGESSAVGDYAILYALGPISLGPRVTVSQYAHLCAGSHDLSKADRPLIKSAIEIGADTWIAADAFVGPGVDVGSDAVIGARAVVMKNVAPGHIVVGNPARTIKVQ